MSGWNLSPRRTNCDRPLRRVVISGGTHGNERNGVMLAKSYAQRALRFDSFELSTLESNTAAMQANTRYVDVDMNRCFTLASLGEGPGTNIETRRAVSSNLPPPSPPTPLPPPLKACAL